MRTTEPSETLLSIEELVNSPKLEVPRIYVDIADERMDGRKVAFVISNHGGDVAHKTQVEPLRLPAGMAECPLIELIPAHSQKRILPEVEKANIFERHDIARLLMKEWDAAGKVN